MLIDIPLFPTSTGGWASMRQGLYINDDKVLARHFQDSGAVHFLHEDLVSESNLALIFCQLCGIPTLSQSIETETMPSHYINDSRLSRIIKDTFPLMQRWIFWCQSEKYEQISALLEPKLPRFQSFLCGEVFKIFKLNGFCTNAVLCPVAIDCTVPSIHVTKPHAADYYTIFYELSRLFYQGVANREFATFAALLIQTKVTGSCIDSVLQSHGCWSLFPCCQEALDALEKSSRSPPTVLWDPPLAGEYLNKLENDGHLNSIFDGLMAEPTPLEPRSGERRREPVAVWPPPPAGYQSDAGAGFRGGEGVFGEGSGLVPSNAASRSMQASPAVSRPDAGARDELESASVEGGSADCRGRAAFCGEFGPASSIQQEDCLQEGSRSMPGPLEPGKAREHTHSEGLGYAAAPSKAEGRPVAEGGTAIPARGSQPALHSEYGAGERGLPPADLFERALTESAADMSISEMDFEELAGALAQGGGDQPLERTVARCLLSPATAESVGRYGEALVVAYLLRTVSAGVEVEWLNEAGESGACYDICTKVTTPAAPPTPRPIRRSPAPSPTCAHHLSQTLNLILSVSVGWLGNWNTQVCVGVSGTPPQFADQRLGIAGARRERAGAQGGLYRGQDHWSQQQGLFRGDVEVWPIVCQLRCRLLQVLLARLISSS